MLTLFLIIALLPFTGCTPEQDPQLWAKGYIDALLAQDYGRCYALLSRESRERMTLTDFVQRHENVYGAMELTSLAALLDAPVRDGSLWRYPCTLTYRTKRLGDFQQRFLLTLEPNGEQWTVEWSPSFLFEHLDWEESVSLVTLSPQRGEILDAQSWTYAVNTYAPCIFVRPERIASVAATAQQLAPYLQMDEKSIIELMTSERAKTDGLVVLRSWLPGELSSADRDAMLAMPGVYYDDRIFAPIRYYPEHELAAHVVGYTGYPTLQELEKLPPDEYTEGTRIGRTGLEAAYESVMHGKSGLELRILNKDGSVKEAVAGKPKEDGLDLELTLDHDLQRRAVSLLSQIKPGERAAVVVLNPKTGDVLTQASYPSFDPNMFTYPVPAQTYASLTSEASGLPFINRATQGLYAPGSTIKPIMAALGIESGKYTMNTKFSGRIVRTNGKSQWTPPGEWPYPAITRISDYPEPPTMEMAIIKSDNIYFASLALNLGWDRVEDIFQRVGIGQDIPYDLPVAGSKVFSGAPNYANQRLLANTGYGQGELLISPLQLAATMSLFANDGAIMQPRIVRAARRMSGREYEVVQSFENKSWKAGTVEPVIIDAVRPAMRKVMTEGSGQKAQIPGITLLGKTGTAEVGSGDQKREIAWLVAFTGKDIGYDRLVVVMIECEPKGGEMRHEIARQLLMP